MKKLFFVLIFLSFSFGVCAQKFKVIKSYVRFFSDAPVEDIEAVNIQSNSILNIETGEIAFSIPIREFHFAKKLMQEHFNENYLESHKYPNATFQGTISGYDKNKSGLQNAKAIGKMTIHGVTQLVEVEGQVQISTNYLKIKSKFDVKLEDHNIKIPSIVAYNIAETIEVTILFDYAKM